MMNDAGAKEIERSVYVFTLTMTTVRSYESLRHIYRFFKAKQLIDYMLVSILISIDSGI